MVELYLHSAIYFMKTIIISYLLSNTLECERFYNCLKMGKTSSTDYNVTNRFHFVMLFNVEIICLTNEMPLTRSAQHGYNISGECRSYDKS
jgi:hypothetical protein